MSEDSERVAALRTELAKLFGCAPDDFTHESSINNHPGWTSMAHVQMMVFLSKHHGVVIDAETIDLYTRYSVIEELALRTDDD